MANGSCLCGAIEFILDGELSAVRYCHCSNCRKFAGTSPATWAMAEADKLHITREDSTIGRFNSGRGIRCFCSNCGSPLWFESIDYPQIVGIPLGVLDDEDLPKPEMHLWVSARPTWYHIDDDLPRHDKGPS